MATQNRRGYGNPYTSADLGSGARTTTGGSYRNPRLGIEDTTAFSRGVMSTLKTPEQEQSEEKQLEGSINYFGAQQDAILGGLEFKENSSLVKNFTNNQLAKMQIQYAKCSKANNQQCLQQINTDLGIYQKGQANIQNLIQNYADDEMYDAETSNGRFLIDVNGDKIKKADGSFAEIADMTKINNENPSDINIGIALNKNGDKKAVYQFKMNGNTYTANISDYTDNYLKNNFDVRSNIHLNTQTAMNKDGTTSGWVDEPKMLESSTNITTGKGAFEASSFLGYEMIVDDKQSPRYWRNVDTAANTFSTELYKTTSSAGNNSAFNNLAKRLYNNKFTSIVEGYVRPSSENFDSFKRELAALPEDVKLAMLRDEGNEEWKIKNASKGHKRGDNGRAERLDEKYLIQDKYTRKPTDDGGDLGSKQDYKTLIDNILVRQNKTILEGGVEGLPAINQIDFSGNISNVIANTATNELFVQGYRSTWNTLQPLFEKALGNEYTALYGEEAIRSKIKDDLERSYDYTKDDAGNAKLNEEINEIYTDITRTKKNADIFIVKDGAAIDNLNRYRAHDGGAESADAIRGMMNILGKYPATSKERADIEAAYRESDTKKFVDKIYRVIDKLDFDKINMAVTRKQPIKIGDLTIDEYTKKNKFSEAEATQLKYSILRNIALKNNPQNFMIGGRKVVPVPGT